MSCFQLFILTGLFFSLVGCSRGTSTNSELKARGSAGIINGAKADPQDAITKSTVIINLPNGNLCTGILLNDHVVLTAAHCLSHGETGYSARLPGALDRRKYVASVGIEISLPPNPKTNDEGDVLPDLGLLRLKTPLPAPAKVVLESSVHVNDKLTGAGFGFGTTPDRPDYFDMTVISSAKENLKKIYTTNGPQSESVSEQWTELEPSIQEYSENFIFALADQEEKSLCNGDSGGPVYREENGVVHLVGIVRGAFMHAEYGVAACNGAYIQLVTPIGPSLDWIQDKLATW